MIDTRRSITWAVYAAAALTLCLVVERAWEADDAAITVRSIDNLLSGHGLRWNTSERVQVFTHPLWALWMVPPLALGLGWYWTLLGLGVLTTALFGVCFLRSGESGAARLVGVLTLLFSGAFLDFSSSGLENPLTHLLLLGLVAALPVGSPSARDVLRIALVSAALALNRTDALLLALPSAAYVIAAALRAGVPPARVARAVLVGLSPWLAWEAFSIVYYGFPFPNTYYAKLGTGIERATLLRMGLAYYAFSVRHDPWTLLGACLLGVLALRARQSRVVVAVLLGVALHYVYTLWIGGDFMAGRFLAAPLVLLAGLIVSRQVRLPERWALGAAVATLLVGGLSALTPDHPGRTGHSGALNERLQSSRETAMQRVIRKGGVQSGSLRRGAEWREEASSAHLPVVRHAYAIGLLGVAAGPAVHIVDHLALADPLLARLPAGFDPDPQPGHFERMGQWSSPLSVTDACPLEHEVCRFWSAYRESLESGRCTLEDARLCRYWQELRLVTEGTLFSGERWRAIWRLNLGLDDALIDRRHYRDAVRAYPGSLPR